MGIYSVFIKMLIYTFSSAIYQKYILIKTNVYYKYIVIQMFIFLRQMFIYYL